MESIENKIVTNVQKCGRGTIFFADKFVHLFSYESVRKALSSLVEKGVILRVARGIYCYPKIDKVLGLGPLLPSVDDIVNAIAKRNHMKVAPTGVYALNILGLSTQVPMNFVYLTNGWSRSLTILNGVTVKFKQTALKNLSFNSRLAMLITFALKEIGQANITLEQITRIHSLLKNEKKEIIIKDFALMPVWIRQIILKAYNNE